MYNSNVPLKTLANLNLHSFAKYLKCTLKDFIGTIYPTSVLGAYQYTQIFIFGDLKYVLINFKLINTELPYLAECDLALINKLIN